MSSKLSLTLAIALLLVPFLAQGQVIRDFTAAAAGHQVMVRWTSGSESGLQEYQVQRSADGTHFTVVGTVNPLGSGHTYSYTDEDLFKNPQTWYYRIAAVKPGTATEYTQSREVSMISSGIRRTWGSIKMMFR